jgi:hypothetical protein
MAKWLMCIFKLAVMVLQQSDASGGCYETIEVSLGRS